MWIILLGLGSGFAAVVALVGALAASGHESRVEERSHRKRHLSLVRSPRTLLRRPSDG